MKSDLGSSCCMLLPFHCFPGDIVYFHMSQKSFQWQVKVLQIDFNANCWCNLAITMLGTFSHCNLFILLRPPARLLYGTNHDTCDGLEEQDHDVHCHLGTFGQIPHRDQCYCHDHGTNHEGAGCLVCNRNETIEWSSVLIVLLSIYLKS